MLAAQVEADDTAQKREALRALARKRQATRLDGFGGIGDYHGGPWRRRAARSQRGRRYCAGRRHLARATTSTASVPLLVQVHSQPSDPAGVKPASASCIVAGSAPLGPVQEPLNSMAPFGQLADTVAKLPMAIDVVVLATIMVLPANGGSAGSQSHVAASALLGASSLQLSMTAIPAQRPETKMIDLVAFMVCSS